MNYKLYRKRLCKKVQLKYLEYGIQSKHLPKNQYIYILFRLIDKKVKIILDSEINRSLDKHGYKIIGKKLAVKRELKLIEELIPVLNLKPQLQVKSRKVVKLLKDVNLIVLGQQDRKREVRLKQEMTLILELIKQEEDGSARWLKTS